MVKTVLIIEDNDMNMKLFNDLLQAHNYNTILTKKGTEAHALAQEHHPDLIVMDIQLPDMSGLEATQLLKTDDALKEIPVVAVTALAMKGDKERCLESGCDAYISKPISVPAFLETVKDLIN